MSKLIFYFPENWKECQAEIKSMSRLVTTIVIRNMTIFNIRICKVLRKFGSQFKVLIFDNVGIDAQIFMQLVNMFQLDKLIILNNSRLVNMKNAKFDLKVEGKVLNMIAMISLRTEVLETLNKMKLQCRKLVYKINFSNESTYSNWDMLQTSLVKFMAQQMNLKKLVVNLPASKVVFSHLVDQLKSKKLVKLSIYLEYSTYVPELYDGLAELLKSQSDLKELEIKSGSISSDSINAIFHIQGLQTLKFYIHCIPLITHTDSIVQTNLKKFILLPLSSCPAKTLEVMLKVFSSIETLGVISDDDSHNFNMLQCAHQNLKSLQYLGIDILYKETEAIAFPSLRKLQIGRVQSERALVSFLSHNPLLEELEIENLRKFGDSIPCFPSEPRESVDLKKLVFSNRRENHNEKDTFAFLENRCQNLTKIEVCDDRWQAKQLNQANYIVKNLTFKNVRVDDNDVFYKFSNLTFDVMIFDLLVRQTPIETG